MAEKDFSPRSHGSIRERFSDVCVVYQLNRPSQLSLGRISEQDAGLTIEIASYSNVRRLSLTTLSLLIFKGLASTFSVLYCAWSSSYARWGGVFYRD